MELDVVSASDSCLSSGTLLTLQRVRRIDPGQGEQFVSRRKYNLKCSFLRMGETKLLPCVRMLFAF